MAAAISLLILIGLVLAGTAPSVFGYESFIVYSGSMEPALGVGDLAVVAPTKPDQLHVGDILTYRPVEQPSLLVTHRLVDIGLDDIGQFTFHTKGDANNVIDRVAVSPGAVVGRVAYSIPKLGYLVDFAKRPEGRVLLIVIPGVLLAVHYLLGARRRSRGPLRFPRSDAAERVARGRIALNNGAVHAAMALADEAIASEPRLEAAWLLKAECLNSPESIAVLRAALTVNPTSKALQRALELESVQAAQSSS